MEFETFRELKKMKDSPLEDRLSVAFVWDIDELHIRNQKKWTNLNTLFYIEKDNVGKFCLKFKLTIAGHTNNNKNPLLVKKNLDLCKTILNSINSIICNEKENIEAIKEIIIIINVKTKNIKYDDFGNEILNEETCHTYKERSFCCEDFLKYSWLNMDAEKITTALQSNKIME